MTENFKIESLNIIRKKAASSEPVREAVVTSLGLEGDIHTGHGHRQISLLAAEDIERFAASAGRIPAPEEFSENITTRGLDFGRVAVLDRFVFGDVEFEVTQIGTSCHTDSSDTLKGTECLVRTHGLFTRVKKPGKLAAGMGGRFIARPLRFLIITLSDRASAGIYEDRSGPAIETTLKEHFKDTREHLAIERVMIPDDPEQFKRHLREAVDSGVDFVLSTGSTGLGPRDIAPETTRSIIEKELPGLMEYIRMKYGQQKLAAVMSRGLAGSAGSTFIMNAPGSVRGATEYASEFVKVWSHIRNMIHSIDAHC